MREEQIFHEVLEQAAEKCAAFLADACGADIALRQRVEVLLQAQANPGSFLQVPAPGNRNSPTIDQPPVEISGTIIGPYKLLQQIGEGGMGTVYMAEQTQPVQRKVALKVIKAGMDSHQVIARFEAERQALAVMDHPHIAKVLDAGTTPDGRPFFVMELVPGLPLTDYCDAHTLPVAERLDLF
ncbi:MAG TPA: protein kinase, partial [Pirellulaceae bacterium]|nr:protein kinase [Pirellulaceae bacterium]